MAWAEMTWQTHLINNAVVLVLLATLDHLIIKPFVQARLGRVKADGEKKPERRQAESARWFFVHSLANVGVVATSVVSMQCVLLDPLHAMDGTVHTDRSFFGAASAWPLTIINSVHVYHLIGGFKLNAGERFHHFVFIPTLGFPGQAFCWGALSNWQAFFISGLPGAIDYGMLGFQKIGMLNPLTEKRVNANLNVWCRGPGIGAATLLLYQAMVYGHHQVPTWALALQLLLPPYNALYYGKQAVANYAVHYMLDLIGQDELMKRHIETRTSVTTGTEIMSWKDALGVPQRGS